jgi:hypothetical protein
MLVAERLSHSSALIQAVVSISSWEIRSVAVCKIEDGTRSNVHVAEQLISHFLGHVHLMIGGYRNELGRRHPVRSRL